MLPAFRSSKSSAREQQLKTVVYACYFPSGARLTRVSVCCPEHVSQTGSDQQANAAFLDAATHATSDVDLDIDSLWHDSADLDPGGVAAFLPEGMRTDQPVQGRRMNHQIRSYGRISEVLQVSKSPGQTRIRVADQHRHRHPVRAMLRS
jgi:hypothetical protein